MRNGPSRLSSRGGRWDVALALAVAVVQIVGTYGAAHGQTDREPLDALALLLLAAGPFFLRPNMSISPSFRDCCARRFYRPSYQVAVDVRRNPTPWYKAAAASVPYEIFTRWAPLVTRRSIPAQSIARARPCRWNSSSTLTGSTSPNFVVGSNQYSE
jgi:hypothetical protein